MTAILIPCEDACDYTQIGCVETVIPGKSNPYAVTGETNLLKAIEYVFCNGNSMMYPDFKPGAETGELDAIDAYEKFYKAVKKQIYQILDLTCFLLNFKIILSEGRSIHVCKCTDYKYCTRLSARCTGCENGCNLKLLTTVVSGSPILQNGKIE